MKLIKTVDAVGHVLCHDMTKIVPGIEKGAKFRKGHIVTEEDIPELLAMGKEHLYIWKKTEGMLHEDEAAEILCKICQGENIGRTLPKEGKIELRAECDGLLKINREKLLAVNSLGEMMIATKHGDFPVKKGERLGATRVIPLIIEEEKMKRAQEAAGEEPILTIRSFSKKKVGIVTTGNEVFLGRIEDAFGPAVRKKLAEYDVEIIGQTILGDDPEKITAEILNYIEKGADMVLTTGGMSVDPDDTTPTAIKAASGELISYGAPVLPGAMFLLAYQGDVPILGLPGCVMYAKSTIFDLILPRVAAKVPVSRRDITILGHGGLCLGCAECRYPACSFGKA